MVRVLTRARMMAACAAGLIAWVEDRLTRRVEVAAPEPLLPPGRPLIARAADWPPPPPLPLDLGEFELMPAAGRAGIAAIIEPQLHRLEAAVLEWLASQAFRGDPERLVARALHACTAELAGLIESIDRYNADPESTYRIGARLKLFLVECAIAEVAETARRALAETASTDPAIAA
jgi:hypothetical protein